MQNQQRADAKQADAVQLKFLFQQGGQRSPPPHGNRRLASGVKITPRRKRNDTASPRRILRPVEQPVREPETGHGVNYSYAVKQRDDDRFVVRIFVRQTKRARHQNSGGSQECNPKGGGDLPEQQRRPQSPGQSHEPVSYTHLTLPTIYSV